MSDEGKERLSEIAKERHRNGDFKPKPGSSRPSHKGKKRVSQKVAEAARQKKNAEAIIGVFQDAMADTQPMSIRLKAAQAWVQLDLSEAKISRQADDSESQKLDRATLITMLSEKLTSGHASVLLRRQMEQEQETDDGVIEGHVIEEQGQLLPPEE